MMSHISYVWATEDEASNHALSLNSIRYESLGKEVNKHQSVQFQVFGLRPLKMQDKGKQVNTLSFVFIKIRQISALLYTSALNV